MCRMQNPIDVIRIAATNKNDQNLVCVDNLKVTTKITDEYIVRLTNQKSVLIPVLLTDTLPRMYKVKKKMIKDSIRAYTIQAK